MAGAPHSRRCRARLVLSKGDLWYGEGRPPQASLEVLSRDDACPPLLPPCLPPQSVLCCCADSDLDAGGLTHQDNGLLHGELPAGCPRLSPKGHPRSAAVKP